MKRKLKIFLGIFAGILLILGIVSIVYINDYYRAEETLVEYSEEIGVELSSQDRVIILYPEEENDLNQGIIFYPGGKVEYTAYIPLLSLLAKAGYTCFLPHMPGNLAVFDADKAGTIVEEHPEIDSWILMGHSLGGAMAASYAADTDGVFSDLILLGAYPTKSLADSSISMLSIVGTQDGVVNRENLEENKVNAPEDVVYEEIEGGNHAYYGDYGEQEGDGTASITPEEQRQKTVELILQFLEERN